jgi:hypothetical protein
MLGFPIVAAKGIMASNLIEMYPPHSGEGDTQLLHCIACWSRTGVGSLNCDHACIYEL